MWMAQRDDKQRQRVEQEQEKSPQGLQKPNLRRLENEINEKVAPTSAETESLGSSQDLGPKGLSQDVVGTSQP